MLAEIKNIREFVDLRVNSAGSYVKQNIFFSSQENKNLDKKKSRKNFFQEMNQDHSGIYTLILMISIAI